MSTESTNSNPTLTQPEPGEERSAADRLEQLIHAQPELVSTAITANFDAIRESATLVAAARRVRLAGAGHSAAVAEVGEHLLRSVGIDARATHAFDLATYPPGFDANDLLVAVASSEDRAFASRAVQRASHAGLPSVAVVAPSGRISNATVTIPVGPDEELPIGLVCVPAGVAALAAVAGRFEPRSSLAESLPALREVVRSMLASRDVAAEVAAPLPDPERRLLLVAAGPAMPLARAAALALAEAGGLLAIAQVVEDVMLGGLRALRPGDLVVQIAPAGPADARHRDLARVCTAAGIERWRIGSGADGARWHTELPAIDEALSPVAAAIPLLWFAHALLDGTEPQPTAS